jgi:hypothetical protein
MRDIAYQIHIDRTTAFLKLGVDFGVSNSTLFLPVGIINQIIDEGEMPLKL